MPLRKIALLLALAAIALCQGPIIVNPPDAYWATVGAGALTARPTSCRANHDVFMCTGSGCTSGNNIYYCTATNTWTAQGTAAGSGITSLNGLTAGTQTFANDTNVTITSAGSTHTLGWSGTLAAGRLNSNVVQGVTNDTNVTGSISAQNLALGWTGTLAAARLNSNVVQAITNDTNVTGNISAQNLTLGWTGMLSNARGGTGQNTSSSTGIAQVASGTWSVSTALANGTTATTQSESDTSAKVATDAFVANIVTLGSLTTAAGGAFGTAAYDNTGTSGATIPLLNGNLTFSGNDIFSGTLNFSGLTTGTQVSCLGLTSGNAVVAQSGACGSGGSSYTFNYPLSNSSSTVSLLYSSADFGLNGSNQLDISSSKWLNIAADQAGTPLYCPSTNGTTAMTCSLSGAAALTTYTTGMVVIFSSTTANPLSVNIDSVGVINFKLGDGSTSPPSGLIGANVPFAAYYDGMVFRIVWVGYGPNIVVPGALSTGSGSTGCGSASGCVSMTGTSTRPSGASGAATIESNNGGTGLLATLNGGSEVPVPTVSGSTPTNNDCAKFSVSGSLVSITDAGAGCAALPTDIKTRSCEVVWGGTGTSNALQSGDDAIADNSCFNEIGSTETITAVYCMSDVASNTVTINPTFGSAGSGTTILSSALTCGSSYAYSSSGTVSSGSLTNGTGISPVMGGTLNAHSIHMLVVYTLP